MPISKLSQYILARFITHLYHSANSKSLSFDFNGHVEGHDDGS